MVGRVSGGCADEEERQTTRVGGLARGEEDLGTPRGRSASAESARVSSRTRVPERRVVAPERVIVVVQLERPHLAAGRAPTPFRRAR